MGYVNDIDVDVLISEYRDMNKSSSAYSERFQAIRKKAFDDYINVLGFSCG